jgi:hypothetical protein
MRSSAHAQRPVDVPRADYVSPGERAKGFSPHGPGQPPGRVLLLQPAWRLPSLLLSAGLTILLLLITNVI